MSSGAEGSRDKGLRCGARGSVWGKRRDRGNLHRVALSRKLKSTTVPLPRSMGLFPESPILPTLFLSLSPPSPFSATVAAVVAGRRTPG